jgi:hypothetical protein
MKYFCVTAPCGYEVYKYFKGLDETTVKDIALTDLEDNFSSWLEHSSEFMKFYSRATIDEVSKEDYEDYIGIEIDEEDDCCEDYGHIDTDK